MSRDVVFHEHLFPFKDSSKVTKGFLISTDPNPPIAVYDDFIPFTSSHPCEKQTTQTSNTSITSSPNSVGQCQPILEPESHTQAHDLHPTLEIQPPLHRSVREKHPPHYLKDFTCLISECTSSSPYPLTNHLSFSKFNPTHCAFLNTVITTKKPKTFTEAMKHSHWRDAMTKEIEALESHNTWTLFPLPDGKSAVGSKWVYKIKFRADGSIERYKARLVAKGHTTRRH